MKKLFVLSIVVFMFLNTTAQSKRLLKVINATENTGYSYALWKVENTKIDTFCVTKYLNQVWMQGLIPFTEDTAKLIRIGWARDADLNTPTPVTFPIYHYYKITTPPLTWDSYYTYLAYRKKTYGF